MAKGSSAGERSAEEIRHEIEVSREQLASSIDQLTYRANPKRVSEKLLDTVKTQANTTPGRIVIGAAGGLVVLLIVRRVRKH